MPLESEKAIEDAVCMVVGLLHGRSLKLNTYGHAHWPDRMHILPGGVVCFIEYKRQGERPRPAQLFTLKQLRDMGVNVTWADNVPDAITFLATTALSSPQCPPSLREWADGALISTGVWKDDDYVRRLKAFTRSWAEPGGAGGGPASGGA